MKFLFRIVIWLFVSRMQMNFLGDRSLPGCDYGLHCKDSYFKLDTWDIECALARDRDFL